MTSRPGMSVMFSNSKLSEGLNFGLQWSKGVKFFGGQIGYTFGENRGKFYEGGFSTPGASGAFYYTKQIASWESLLYWKRLFKSR